MEKRLYAIRIEETLARSVAVWATSLEEAIDKVAEIYADGGIELGYRDYCDTDIVPHPICEDEGYVVSEEEANEFAWDIYGGEGDE